MTSGGHGQVENDKGIWARLNGNWKGTNDWWWRCGSLMLCVTSYGNYTSEKGSRPPSFCTSPHAPFSNRKFVWACIRVGVGDILSTLKDWNIVSRCKWTCMLLSYWSPHPFRVNMGHLNDLKWPYGKFREVLNTYYYVGIRKNIGYQERDQVYSIDRERCCATKWLREISTIKCIWKYFTDMQANNYEHGNMMRTPNCTFFLIYWKGMHLVNIGTSCVWWPLEHLG